jgi:N-acetylneuraminate synthase
MSTEAEILETIKVLEAQFSPFALMHCNGTYPPPLQDVNLRYIKRLEFLSGRPVGYSGHERGINVAIAAVALGAVVIEKHITLDKSLEGSDHRISLLPQEFSTLVDGIREVSEALGNDSTRKISQGEMLNRTTLAKSLFTTSDLAKGHLVTSSDLISKSPGHGLQPNKIKTVLGKRLERPIKRDEPILLSHFERDRPVKDFGEPKVGRWGLPVRFHDFKELYELGQPQLLEFHMTYSDLNLDIENFFATEIDAELVVHAPELFERDHLLDLTSPDKKYRRLSIERVQRTIDVCNHLKCFFNNRRSNIGVVINVGGFTEEIRLDDSACALRVDNFRDSLSKLDLRGIEILPQTMPPFPWLLGGQRIHNLFTDPSKIRKFCQEESMRICLDVSHSALFCNYHGRSLDEFLEEVLPYTAHLHLADASGSDGEGLQISEGSINFEMVAEKVGRLAPEASWIPEIWQGHEDSGREFWVALTRLQAAGF